MAFQIQEALEVRTALDARGANDLIAQGWRLLDIATGKDEMGYPLSHYILGRFPTPPVPKS